MTNTQDKVKYLIDNGKINVNGEWAQFQGLKNKTRWKEELSKTALKQINSVYKKATKVPKVKPTPRAPAQPKPKAPKKINPYWYKQNETLSNDAIIDLQFVDDRVYDFRFPEFLEKHKQFQSDKEGPSVSVELKFKVKYEVLGENDVWVSYKVNEFVPYQIIYGEEPGIKAYVKFCVMNIVRMYEDSGKQIIYIHLKNIYVNKTKIR